MTEKEKMLRQMLYDSNNDTDLIEERKAAKVLCYDFNHITQLFSSALHVRSADRTASWIGQNTTVEISFPYPLNNTLNQKATVSR